MTGIKPWFYRRRTSYVVRSLFGDLKKHDRVFYTIVLLLAMITLVASLIFYCQKNHLAQQILVSSGLLATIAGVMQLEVSGVFDRIFKSLEKYRNSAKCPPSSVCREIISSPEHPTFEKFRFHLLFNPRTGLWIIVVGTALQLCALWV